MKRLFLLIALSSIISAHIWADSSIPLNFTAVNGPATIAITNDTKDVLYTIEYSTDNCTTWNSYTLNQSIQLTSGSKVFFRTNTTYNTGFNTQSYPYYFVMTGTVAADGNIMSLSSIDMNSDSVCQYSFQQLFINCKSLIQAPELPSLSLGTSCYESMFEGCTSLTQAPALPATKLGNNCYKRMFANCTSLTQAPALPSTNLASGCYSYMFTNCSSLSQAPVLPATTMADECYSFMFEDCKSLTQAPDLPATTLADACYAYMFQRCSSLDTAPVLPATRMEYLCYSNMFVDCTGLTKAPDLPATILAEYCYNYMFAGCSKLTSIPYLRATALTEGCYRYMFSNCSSLEVNTQKPGIQWFIRASSTADKSLDYMFLNTKGNAPSTPFINTLYYINQELDTTDADIYFYCEKVISSVTVKEYHLTIYKQGGKDTTKVVFSSDTSFTMARMPREIVIIDSVTGSTTTITITISNAYYDNNVHEIRIHMRNLAPKTTYNFILMPISEAGNIMSRLYYTFTTIPPDDVYDDEKDDDDDDEIFFPTEKTDVYLFDGRYVGKYSDSLPPGGYIMREGPNVWKMIIDRQH